MKPVYDYPLSINIAIISQSLFPKTFPSTSSLNFLTSRGSFITILLPLIRLGCSLSALFGGADPNRLVNA